MEECEKEGRLYKSLPARFIIQPEGFRHLIIPVDTEILIQAVSKQVHSLNQSSKN